MNQLLELVPKNKKILFFCIGSTKSTGDAIGPMVGSALKRNGVLVYGTIRKPIHALNIEEKIRYVKKKYPNHFIIAIDAAITKIPTRVNQIEYRKGSVSPGSAVGKKLTSIGDVSIYPIIGMQMTGHNSKQVSETLSKKPFNEVIKMRDEIIKECLEFVSIYKQKKSIKKIISTIFNKK